MRSKYYHLNPLENWWTPKNKITRLPPKYTANKLNNTRDLERAEAHL